MKVLLSLGLGTALLSFSGVSYAQRDLPLAFLSFDAVYASDSGDTLAAEGFTGSRIFRIRPDGTTAVAADGLEGPIDIAEDEQGVLYVTNFRSGTVSRVAADGQVSTFATVLPFPAGIVRDASGNLFVSQYGAFDPVTGLGTGDAVLKIDPQGTVTVFAQGGLIAAPVGLAIGDDGRLYVGNFHDGKVIALDSNGAQTLVADVADPPISFAIGHLEFANGRIFATGVEEQVLYRINPRNGRVRSRDISGRAPFPNGIAYQRSSHSLLLARGFAPNANLVRIRLREQP